MTNTFEHFIRETITDINHAAVRVTRTGLVAAMLTAAGCNVTVNDDFNARLQVADTPTADNQDASVINPSDINGLDASLPDTSTMDIGQPFADAMADAQALDAGIDSSIVMDSPLDTSEVEDSQMVDATIPSDLVIERDINDVLDVADVNDVLDAPSVEGPTTDTTVLETGTDSGLDANETADSTLPREDLGTSDIYDSATDTTDSALDIFDVSDTSLDVPTDSGVDVRITGPVINRPSGSAQPSCNRIIIEGIPGCIPGSATCEYNTRVGGQIRYYLETVTIPTGWMGPTIYYRFQSMLGEPQIRDFASPDTAQFTPVFTGGTYPTRATMVLSPAIFSTCNGPTIIIVNR